MSLFSAAFLVASSQPSRAQEVMPRMTERRGPERLPEKERLDPREAAAARALWDPPPKSLLEKQEVILLEPPAPDSPLRVRLSDGARNPIGFREPNPVRGAQQRLRELGYLHSDADIDGIMGQKTRLAAKQFQQASHLEVTGELDDATVSALGVHSSWPVLFSRHDLSHFDTSVSNLHSHETLEPILNGFDTNTFRVTESTSPDSIRYQLHDTSNTVIGQSLDRQQLAAKLNELLTLNGGKAIAIDLPGFSTQRADALGSSLTIQLRQIDPSSRLATTPQLTLTPPDERLATTPTIWMRSSHIVIEKTSAERFSTSVRFSDFFAKGREVTLTIVHSSLNVILDFLVRLRILESNPIVTAGGSLQRLVDQARADLKKTHRELNDSDLQIMITDQAGNTGLAELQLETTFACS